MHRSQFTMGETESRALLPVDLDGLGSALVYECHANRL
jgi:hypothetical protein